MATLKTLLRQIDDITECPICAESLKEPKLLPCVHTFCLHCLETFGKDRKPGADANCPLCGKIFAVPSGGFKDLPNNYFISQLLRGGSPSSADRQSAQDIDCEICTNLSRKAKATVFCLQCSEHHCESCAEVHRVQKCSRTHQHVNVNDKPIERVQEKMAEQRCEQHREPICSFCEDCRAVACDVCRAERHGGHNCCGVDESAEKIRSQIAADIEKVRSSAIRTRERLNQVEAEHSGFLERSNTVQSEISERCDQLRSIIDRYRNELMEKIASYEKKRLKKCENLKEELERECVSRESFVRYCEEMKARGTSCDLSRDGNELHGRAEELIKSQREMANSQQLPSAKITFIPSPATSVDNIKNWIGELSFNTTRSCNVNDDNPCAALFLRRPTVQHVLNSKISMIRGVAILGGEIFLAGESTTQIEVYDSKSFASTRQLLLPGPGTARALTSCPHHACLYVSTTDGRSIIHRFDLPGNTNSQWALSGRCYGLSVTKDFHVLASDYDSNRIQEYTTRGSLVREIAVSRGNLYGCVQLSGGDFVVSLLGSEQRICVVDSSGQVLRSYGGPKGSGDGQLYHPYQLTVDKCDNVLVADYGNARIVVLASSLTLLGYVKTPGSNLACPWALHLDSSIPCLYVAEENGRVLVLKANGGEKKWCS